MTGLSTLAQTLRQSLGAGIGVGVMDPRARVPRVWPAEEPATAKMRDKRRNEFAAGRAAARAAMADLGLPQRHIPMQTDRAPLWPVGLCGSISHTKNAALAVVARTRDVRGIGIDIEEEGALATDLWPEILTPAEAGWLASQPQDIQRHLATQFFSAKEAVYKAQYPLTSRLLTFHDLAITWWQAEKFHAALPADMPLPRTVAGGALRTDGMIVTFTFLARDFPC